MKGKRRRCRFQHVVVSIYGGVCLEDMLKQRINLDFPVFFWGGDESDIKSSLATLYFYVRCPSTVEPVVFLFCTEGEDLGGKIRLRFVCFLYSSIEARKLLLRSGWKTEKSFCN